MRLSFVRQIPCVYFRSHMSHKALNICNCVSHTFLNLNTFRNSPSCRFYSYNPSIIRLMAHINDSKPLTSPGRISLEVIGAGCLGLPGSVYLFTDQTRYLFNCGEGTQRLAHEYKQKISTVDHVFLTSTRWENIGGLLGLSLTLQDIGVQKITLHGPPGMNELYTATQRFVVLNKMRTGIPICDSNSTFEDSVMTVKYVPLESNKTESSEISDTDNMTVEDDDINYYSHEINTTMRIKNPDLKILLSLPRRRNFPAMSYICKMKPRLGTLNLEKCVDKGVKPGPLLGLLKNGQDVTLPDGTIVYAKDVRMPDDPGPVIIVIDVPDMSYLDSLLKSDKFHMHQEKTALDANDLATVIIHFTPNEIVKTEKYQEFISKFPLSTYHLMVNDGNQCFGSVAIHKIQHQLNLLNKEVFPLLPYKESDEVLSNSSENPDNIILENGSQQNIIKCKTLTTLNLRPKIELDSSKEIKLDIKSFIETPFEESSFKPTMEEYHNVINKLKQNSTNTTYPKIVFLGTGSCIPNKTRNTSGIMLHIDEDHSILLDCGEGTFGQMVRFYGQENIHKVLKTLKAIYVSHLHADHHIGLINILLHHKKVTNKSGDTPIDENRLYLLAPKQIITYLYNYDKRFERIFSQFKLVYNSDLQAESDDTTPNIPKMMFHHLNVSNIQTCIVKHCIHAFGISIITNDNKKVTYSGDTMPCQSLISLGANSDILIHEATMEDELIAEACRKLHSTTQQAVEVAKQMNAKHTILTHFSQRYARVPRLLPEIENLLVSNNVGIAFDNMEIEYKNLNILPHAYPSLKSLFVDHCVDLDLKATKRALREVQLKKRVKIL